MKRVIYTIILLTSFIFLGLLYGCNPPAGEQFSMNNLYPWCIVAFDSLERSPAERIQMLNEFGFRKYAYDWRDKHLDEMLSEIRLAEESSIEIIGVWLWINAKRDSLHQLSPANTKLFEIIEESGLKTSFWLSFNNNYFEGLSQEESILKGVTMVDFIASKAQSIGCNVALYNHSGWFGNPYNQIEIIKLLPQHKLKMVYNFHHAHEQIDVFSQLVDDFSPYLAAVNLNGMREGGPKIMTIGEGDHERNMIEILLENGYQGPWGILGHVENKDVRKVLEQNLSGLESLY